MKLFQQQNKAFMLPIVLACLVSVSVLGCKPEVADPTADPTVETPEAPVGDPESPETPETPAPESPKTETPKKPEPETPKTPEPTTKTPTPITPTVKTPSPTTPSPTTPSVKAAGNLTAEQAARAAITAISEGNVPEVFNALPASYQKDVVEVVQLFSKNMDAEVWDGGIGAFKKLASVLKSKKTLLLDPQNLAIAKMEKEEAGVAFDHIIGVLEGFSTCDLVDLEKLKKFNGASSLKMDSNMFKHFESLVNIGLEKDGKKSKFRDITKTKITVLSSDKNSATLKFDPPEGSDEKSKEEKFIKVEGKWVSEDLAPEKWKEKMDEARSEIAKLGPALEQNKASVLQVYGMINGTLDNIDKAETKEQLQAQVMPLVVMLGPLLMQASEGVLHGKEEQGTPKTVVPEGDKELPGGAKPEEPAKGDKPKAAKEPAAASQ